MSDVSFFLALLFVVIFCYLSSINDQLIEISKSLKEIALQLHK